MTSAQNFSSSFACHLLLTIAITITITITAVRAAPEGEEVVYRDIIAPILDQKCASCHGAERQKGKFRLDGYDNLVKGGKEGKGVVPGKPNDSSVVARVELHEGEDGHMPPKDKKQLESHEVKLLKWWIDGGASQDAKVADLKPSSAIKVALEKVVPAGAKEQDKAAPGQQTKDAVSQRESIRAEVERLRKEFPTALNLEAKTPEGVSFSVPRLQMEFGDQDLAKLAPVMPVMVSLDLSSSKVTDQGALVLKDAAWLKGLKLSQTGITDVSLDVLATLPELQSLNLDGTQVTNAGLLKLASAKNLQWLYLSKTKVDASGIQAFKEKLPACKVTQGP